MFISNIPTNVLTPSATQQEELGTIWAQSAASIQPAARASMGGRLWRYIQNGTGGSVVAGKGLRRKAGATTAIGDLPGTSVLYPNTYLGVTQYTVPQDYYCWVLFIGYGLVLADAGNIGANTILTTGNGTSGAFDGIAITTVTEASGLGFAPEAITAGATGYAWISIPF